MPLQSACAASKEERVLPLLYPETRARHEHSKRIDTIPQHYAEMSGEELDWRIARARATLGDRLVILGHHYQRDEIIKYADFRGDSFKLAQLAAARPQADYIVFCGVHFMAESADILSAPHQRVILPNPAAGCSMADMANIAEVEECWEMLTETLGDDAERHPGDLYELGGQPQGILRTQWRHCLHFFECSSSDQVGLQSWQARTVLPG